MLTDTRTYGRTYMYGQTIPSRKSLKTVFKGISSEGEKEEKEQKERKKERKKERSVFFNSW